MSIILSMETVNPVLDELLKEFGTAVARARGAR